MPERFTETLRATSEVAWSHAVQHHFVQELFAGALPDAVMARYLIQDHRFLDSFLVLLGAALVNADTFEARLRFGGPTAGVGRGCARNQGRTRRRRI
jgi:thiaminase/transcriptional activator TenA